MTALVMGTDDWATEQLAGLLASDGHTVVRCHEPGDSAFPCNALVEGRQCPLDAGFDVAVTARSRVAATPTPGEQGVVCTLRHGIPLVVAGIGSGHVFDQWASAVVGPAGDVVTACQTVRRTAEVAR